MTTLKTAKNSNRGIYILIALSLAGIVLSWLLTGRFYDLRDGASGFKSICNISQTMNCDAVAASRYSEFVGGLPLSSFAAGWYLALLVVSLLALIDDWRREALRGALLFTVVGTVFSVIYFFVMASVIHSFCLYCLIIDGVNVAALITVLALKPAMPKAHPLDRDKWKTMLWVTLGSMLVAMVLLKQMEGRPIDRATVVQTADSILSGAPMTVAAGEEFPSIGPKDAPVTIVEFSDFQCPFCRVGALTLDAVLKRHPGQVRVVFRNYPLDPACNPGIQRSMHPAACEAAKTAVCANKSGKFQEVYEEIFEHQAEIRPGKPVEMAKVVGVNAEQLTACLGASDTALAITKDIDEGNRLGVQSTPTFFINGHKIEGVSPLPVWSELIDRLAARK